MMKFYPALFIIYLFTLSFLTGCGNSPGNSDVTSSSLREQAIQELRLNLRTESKWEKVHAAEFLLWLNYPEEVHEIFIEEQQRYGDESPYRIGIWRVLAQSATEPENKRFWIDKILKAYQDPNGPDRIHAAETLAKLKISPLIEDPVVTRKIINEKKSPLSVYTLWGASLFTNDSVKSNRSAFLNLLSPDQHDATLRKIAAYSLRHLNNLTAKEWHLLAETALSEHNGSEVRIYLLSAAFVIAPDDSVQSKTYGRIWKELLKTKNSSHKADRMEMAAALAEKGTPEDLPVLLSLLNNENPINNRGIKVNNSVINNPENSDVRAAAAYAILRIDRRQEYFLEPGDWLVVVIYLLGMLGIGFFYSRKNKDVKDFLLGGGKMNPVAVGLSLFATLLSSLSYLSYPGEMIKYGPVVLSGVVVFPLVYYVVGWFLIPRFMNMNVTSAYEILEIKLGVSIRMLATFFFLSLRFLWMATIIYVTVNAAILSMFNIDPSYSLLVGATLIIVTIIYTSMGGLKAVVFTDVIQSIVLLGGAVLTLLIVSVQFGSFTAWLPDQWLGHWDELKFALDARERLSLSNAALMAFIYFVAFSGSDQMSIQRFLATKDIKSARKTFGISLLTNFIAQVLLGLVGLALIAYFTTYPQYLADGKNISDQSDLLFPKFILVGFPIGISGLVAAGILAAAMSSLSSGLNSSSSVISEDILKRLGTRVLTPINDLKQVKKLSILVGVFTLLLSVVISYVEGNLYDIIVKVVNLFVSPLFVLFCLTLFVPFATARGTFIGGIVSVMVAVAIAFFSFLGIEVLFITPASLFAGIIVGVICSFVDHKVFGNQQTASNRSKNSLTAQAKNKSKMV
jgi:SSS family solute:Na+ symporter